MKNIRIIDFDIVVIMSLFVICLVVCLTMLITSFYVNNRNTTIIKTNEITNTSVNTLDTMSWSQPW